MLPVPPPRELGCNRTLPTLRYLVHDPVNSSDHSLKCGCLPGDAVCEGRHSGRIHADQVAHGVSLRAEVRSITRLGITSQLRP